MHRTAPHRTVRALFSILLSAFLIGGGQATAADVTAPGEEIADYESIPFTEDISSSEFSQAREEARETPDSPAEVALETEFLQDAALDHGNVYARDEVEVVDLGVASLVGPVDLDVSHITLSYDGFGEVEAVMDVDPGEIDANAPGSGSESYQTKASGSYKLVIDGVGDGIFTWRKYKLVGEGDSTRDYWAYARKASGQPASVPNARDPRVALLYIRNYPTSATYSILKNWVDDSVPLSDFSGNCDNTPKYIELGFRGAAIGMNFIDCDTNDVARNASVPGEMRIQMSQGTVVSHAGNIGTGYIASFSTSAGGVPYFHDHQKMKFTYYTGIAGGTKSCETINKSNADC